MRSSRNLVAAVVLAVCSISCGSSLPADQPVPDGGGSEAAVAAGGSGGSAGVAGTGGATGATGGTAGGQDAGVVADSSVATDSRVGVDGPALSSGDAPTFSSRLICELGCRNAFALNCPRASSCVADCENDFAITTQKPHCRPQVEAMLLCAVSRPQQDWLCGTDGTLELKEGVCMPEADAAIQCILGP